MDVFSCKNWLLGEQGYQGKSESSLIEHHPTQLCILLPQFSLFSGQKPKESERKKRNGVLLLKLFLPTVRKKNCSSDRAKLLKFEAEGREFAKF